MTPAFNSCTQKAGQVNLCAPGQPGHTCIPYNPTREFTWRAAVPYALSGNSNRITHKAKLILLGKEACVNLKKGSGARFPLS